MSSRSVAKSALKDSAGTDGRRLKHKGEGGITEEIAHDGADPEGINDVNDQGQFPTDFLDDDIIEGYMIDTLEGDESVGDEHLQADHIDVADSANEGSGERLEVCERGEEASEQHLFDENFAAEFWGAMTDTTPALDYVNEHNVDFLDRAEARAWWREMADDVINVLQRLVVREAGQLLLGAFREPMERLLDGPQLATVVAFLYDENNAAEYWGAMTGTTPFLDHVFENIENNVGFPDPAEARAWWMADGVINVLQRLVVREAGRFLLGASPEPVEGLLDAAQEEGDPQLQIATVLTLVEEFACPGAMPSSTTLWKHRIELPFFQYIEKLRTRMNVYSMSMTYFKKFFSSTQMLPA